MAHTKSARKRIRQDEKRHLRNQSVKTRIKGLTKKFRAAVEGSSPEETTKSLQDVTRALGRAASKGIVPRKTASRKIGRLDKAAARKLSSANSEAAPSAT